MPKLAINNGNPVRLRSFPSFFQKDGWPVYDGYETKALQRALYSATWGSLWGNEVKRFEQKFAEYHDAAYGLAVANGTAGLMAALIAAGIQEGDEVIVPAYTFIATAISVVGVNAVPVFADIHPDTYNIDPDCIQRAITKRTKAIIPVHIAGMPADMDRIMRIARKHRLKVIEDAAQAHGAIYRDRKVGAIGDMGVFSFQSTKNLNSGEGGIVLTNDKKLADLCDSIRNYGRSGRGWYAHDMIGYNFRITEFQGAILNAQFTRFEKQAKLREKNALYLNRHLKKIDGIEPQDRKDFTTRASYHLYIMRYDPSKFADLPKYRFISALNAEGICAQGGYGLPLHRQPIFLNKKFGPYTGYRRTNPRLNYSKVKLPVTEKACKQEGVWLPHYVLLGTRKDMDDIIEAVGKIKENVGELIKKDS